jgi:putative FmdB family regulatory protein
MPIFDYRCEACGHTFDVLQKLGDDPLTDCTECGQPQLKKLLSAPAFHLKGKGWRNSDDTPKKPNVRPKFAHTLDSAQPHAEHSHSGPEKPSHQHGHDHSHADKKTQDHGGGVGKIVRDHVHSKDHGHSHSPAKPHSHSHGHSHGHGKGHKHD